MLLMSARDTNCPGDICSGTILPPKIRSILAEQIAADRVPIQSIDLIAFASDASFYRLIPKAVVLAKDETEIASLFQFSQCQGIPMTFLLRSPACQDSRSLMAC